SPPAYDVHLCGEERVGAADDRADVQVVRPVLDRDMERMPPGVEVSDDRVARPIAIAVDDVAPIALAQQLRVEAGIVRPRQRVWAHTHHWFGRRGGPGHRRWTRVEVSLHPAIVSCLWRVRGRRQGAGAA